MNVLSASGSTLPFDQREIKVWKVKFDVKDNFFPVDFADAERLKLVHILESTVRQVLLYKPSGEYVFAVSYRG